MNFETSTLVYNLDLDRTLNLEWGRGRALDRARAIESSTNLDRARARARSGARTISLEDDQFRDLDIAIDRDRKHSFNLDRIVTHAFDRNLGRDPSFDLGNDQDLAILNYSDSDCNLAFDYARNRIRERNLDLDLNLDGDSKLVRNPAIDPDHRRKRNRALARVIVFGLVAYYARLLENIPSRGRFYQSQKDTAYKQLLINYLDIYIDLVVLEERIQGNLPAVESVRLVHEW
jgi:hypothetical protein